MSVRSSVWKLKSRFARSPSAERVELLKGAIGALGEQHGKRAGADWARDNIPTEGAARKVLYALYRSFPPDEKDVFISYDWSDIQNALPYCPTVVDDEVDLGAGEDPFRRGETEFDEVLWHLRIPRFRASDREDVYVSLAGAYSDGWNGAMEAEVVGRAEALANLGALASREVLRAEFDQMRRSE